MNHLTRAGRLANRYRVMRHGQSKANEAGVIVSRIETDHRGDWGLSELGRRQASAAARECGLPPGTVICSSDFSRARQTAEIVRAYLGGPEVIVTEALRERCFGDLEGTPARNYARVWAADAAAVGGGGDGAGTDGVEPAATVLDRATALIAALEEGYAGRDILLVSHGDTLQILQAGFLRMNPAGHRQVPHLETAEIRELRLIGAAGYHASRTSLLCPGRAAAPSAARIAAIRPAGWPGAMPVTGSGAWRFGTSPDVPGRTVSQLPGGLSARTDAGVPFRP